MSDLEFADFTSKVSSSIAQFENSGDVQLAQILKSSFGNRLLREQQNLLNPTVVEQYEGAIDVAIRLGFSVPPNYEGALGKAVKKACEHLLICENNRYSTASHKQIPASMYPAFNAEVEQATRSYCVSKSFPNKYAIVIP
jgi:hypothetical protein